MKDQALLSPDTLLATSLGSDTDPLPQRRVDIDLTPVSLVLSTPLMCYPNSPLEFQLLTGGSRRSHNGGGDVAGQKFKGDVVAAVQPNIQDELKRAVQVSLLAAITEIFVFMLTPDTLPSSPQACRNWFQPRVRNIIIE